jgi:hypothetical protein
LEEPIDVEGWNEDTDDVGLNTGVFETDLVDRCGITTSTFIGDFGLGVRFSVLPPRLFDPEA